MGNVIGEPCEELRLHESELWLQGPQGGLTLK